MKNKQEISLNFQNQPIAASPIDRVNRIKALLKQNYLQ